MFADQGNDFLFPACCLRESFSKGIPFADELVELEIQIATVVGKSFVGGRPGGIHPVAQAHCNWVLGTGASCNFLIFQIGFVIVFYLPGNTGIGKSGFHGNQALFAFGFLKIVCQDGCQFDLCFEIENFFFQRLGRAEVRAHGGIRILDNVAFRLEFGDLFVHVTQGGSEFFQAALDEVFRFKGRLVSFILGNLVVNLDEVVKDVFRFLGITGRQGHFQKAGFFGVRTGDCQSVEQVVSSFKHGLVPDNDSFFIPRIGHQGCWMDGNDGKGKCKRFSVKPFQLD